MSISRRGFFAGGAAAATAATAMSGATGAGKARADVDPDRQNILVVLVDEMRAPMWFPDQEALDRILPNIARIRRGAVSFEQHYTAANDCTPSRGVLLTGLYSHQTGCMMTSQSTLSPLFPTWGSMIREHGYETVWWGKWHLGHESDTNSGSLANYGFAGGTYPSPNGAPGQGLQMDPTIVDQFIGWLDTEAGRAPWCCTVSLVNPHDIQWWPRWTQRMQAQLDIPHWMNDLPANYEGLERLAEKPRLQLALVEASAVAFGLAPYGTSGAEQQWVDMRNLYLWLQQQVDIQIGRVLDALYQRPDVAANTVIVFTSDHGDYAGSHGLHGKGAAAYDEAIRVPLYVHDPRGLLSPTSSTSTRGQLTSSADITPLLLTIASGGSAWRGDARYAHLADRLDIAALCRDRGKPGRPLIVHATDEPTIEEAAVLFNQNAPGHVAAVRTSDAKYVSYSHFVNGRIEIDPAQEQEYELYDYTAAGGQLELDNQAAANGELRAQMEPLLQQAIAELNRPLPPYLRQAQEQGCADYLTQEHNVLSMAQHALGELQNLLPK